MAWFKYLKSTESINSSTTNSNYSYPYCKRFIGRFTPRDTLEANTWIFANISDININTYKDTSLEDQTDETSYIVTYEKGDNVHPVETVIEGDFIHFKTYELHTAAEEIVGQYAVYYNTPNLRKINEVDNAGTDDYQVNLAPVWESIELDLFIYGETYDDSVLAVGTVYSISSGTLPTGTSINSSTGRITGTVNVTGNYSFSIRATTDDGKYYNEASFSGTVYEYPEWVDSTLSNIDYNTSYSDSVWADAYPAVTYLISSGALPSGITLNSTTGVVSGLSTASGPYSFTIKAENEIGSVTQSFSGTVQTPPSWSDQTLGIITQGVSYSDGVSAAGTATIVYSVYSGSLPTGLSLNTSTGAITGTTGSTGSYSFTIRATNSWGYIEKAFSGTIYQIPAWTDSTIANMIYGQAYSDTVAASGYPAVTYSISTGALPSGITLNSSTGAIAGTSTVAGSYSFTVKAENTAGNVTQLFTDDLYVTPSWTDNTLVAFTYNAAYSDGVVATGSPTYTISVGTLPTGLSLNSSTGAVTGTPTYYGAYSFTIQAANETGSVTQSFSGAIYAAPFWTDSTLATPTYNVAYSDSVVAGGYPVPFYTIETGSCPLSLNIGTGEISGTYTAPRWQSSFTYNFTVRAYNPENSNQYVDQAFTWVVTIPFSASGGTITTSGGYTVHTFTSSGNFTVDSGSKSVEYIIVGGGGGGGNNAAGTTGYIWSGGGGAGGLITGTTTLSAGYDSSSGYAIAVGSGGAVNQSGNVSALTINSSPGAVLAIGGGNGGGWSAGASSGGSGGGGWGTTSSSGSGASGASAEGNSGGSGAVGSGGGGGGKGSTGSNGNGSTNVGANGGTGQTFTWGSSLDGFLAGGGGGAGFNGGGSGGSSIGGSGAIVDYNVTVVNATSGTVNRGSGGGGAASAFSYTFNTWRYANGGSGSSGCVIVRYLT